jgi:hypothetical protein
LIDFLRLDSDLVEVAAAASRKGVSGGPPAEELAAWVAGLPRGETDRVLLRLMQGEGVALGGELLWRFREDQARRQVRAGRAPVAGEARRTAGDLTGAWERLAQEKSRRAAERAAKEQARRAREQAAARARHLDALAGREEELWRQAEAAVQTRQPREYDRAVELLKDLRDLGERTGTADEVARRVRALRQRHRGKTTLMQRLDRAGLPQ